VMVQNGSKIVQVLIKITVVTKTLTHITIGMVKPTIFSK